MGTIETSLGVITHIQFEDFRYSIEIGEAKGQNWWCVMFPSLCFIDISSGIVDDEAKENLEQNLEEESYSIISDSKKSNIKFKFKIIEFFAENDLFKIAKNR